MQIIPLENHSQGKKDFPPIKIALLLKKNLYWDLISGKKDRMSLKKAGNLGSKYGYIWTENLILIRRVF